VFIISWGEIMAGSNVWIKCGKVYNLFTEPGTTSSSTGNPVYKDSPFATFQATVVGTGAVTATVVIDVSNDGVYWCSTVLGTVSLSGTTSSSDGFTTTASWKYVRARVTAISGTGATVQVYMGV
jgi:hypothetical protein